MFNMWYTILVGVHPVAQTRYVPLKRTLFRIQWLGYGRLGTQVVVRWRRRRHRQRRSWTHTPFCRVSKAQVIAAIYAFTDNRQCYAVQHIRTHLYVVFNPQHNHHRFIDLILSLFLFFYSHIQISFIGSSQTKWQIAKHIEHVKCVCLKQNYCRS